MGNTIKYLNKTEKHALAEFIKLMQTRLAKYLLKMEIFGSKVSGKFSETSDIDILIIVNNRTPVVMDIIAEITSELNIEFNISLSPVVFSEKEYKKNIEMASPFPLNIEAEGVTL